MIHWSIELTEFDIQYESRAAIKGQALYDFLVEFTKDPVTPPSLWNIHVDGSSNAKGSGAGIIVQGPDGVNIEQALRFQFPTTNNQAEYEALLAGMQTARDIGAQKLKVHTDSQLVCNQVLGKFQVHDETLQCYLQHVKDLASGFAEFDIVHIPRTDNE